MTNRSNRVVAVVLGMGALSLVGLSAEPSSGATPQLVVTCPTVLNQCVASAIQQKDGCHITYKPEGTACNDGNPCTFGETCNGGVGCGVYKAAPAAGTLTCGQTAADIPLCQTHVCNGTSTCGVAPVAAGADCGTTSSDVSACQTKTCNAANACVATPVAWGAACGGPFLFCEAPCGSPNQPANTGCTLGGTPGTLTCVSTRNHAGNGPH